METRRQIDGRRLQEVGIVRAEIELAELIRQTQTTVVRHVEEVRDKADSRTIVDRERNIRVQIELGVERRPSELTASTHRDFTGIQVNGMRQVFANRYARFHVETDSEIQASPEPPIEASTILAERIASIDVRDEAPIRIQISNLELIAEQVEISLCKVKQRTDAGISLTIVVTQVTFVIAAQ